MAVPVNTLVSDVVVGNREDLSDEISRLEPEQTPFMSNIGKTKASATYTEWQIEGLEDIDPDNAHLEGSDTILEESNIRDRVGNRTQIFRRSCVISNTQQAVSTAGVASEWDRQKLLKGIVLKKDVELALMRNRGSNEEHKDSTGATATGAGRRMGGMQAWITSNVSRGAGGANGGFIGNNVTESVAGTPRAFTEDQLREVLLARFEGTGQPNTKLQAYMSGRHKQEFSKFAGLSETRDKVGGSKSARTIFGAADVYIGDFGEIMAIAHPYGISDAVALIDPSMWKVTTLRGIAFQNLAKTGDNMKGDMTCEKTLKSLNEKGSALIADLI